MNDAKLQHTEYQILIKEKIKKHLFFRIVFQKTDDRLFRLDKMKEALWDIVDECRSVETRRKYIKNNPGKVYFTRIVVQEVNKAIRKISRANICDYLTPLWFTLLHFDV